MPKRKASRPRTSFADRRISRAIDRPTSLDRRAVPPWFGIHPRSTSGREKRALSSAILRSHAKASSAPTPRAGPATAATVGFVRCSRAQKASWPRVIHSWAAFAGRAAQSSMSSPDEKGPSPVTTTARTSSSFSNSGIRSASSEIMERRKAFLGGLSIQRMARPPFLSRRMRGDGGIAPRWGRPPDNRCARSGVTLLRRTSYSEPMRGESSFERPWFRSWPTSVPRSISYPDVPVQALLRETARAHGSWPAIRFYGNVLTYRDLDGLADRFAAGLRRTGVRTGDRISLLLPNTPHFVVAFFGILRAGGIVVPTNPIYTPRELEALWTDAGVETVIALDLFWPNVAMVKPSTSLRQVVICDVAEFLRAPIRQLYPIKKKKDLKKGGHWPLAIPIESWIHRFASLVATPAGSEEAPAAHDDVAVLQYTGGTTGTPKGAILKLINKTKPGLFPGVPTMYIAILRSPNLAKYDLRSIRACISGAAPLPNEVRRRFEAAAGGRLVGGDGLTEASPVTHCNPLNGVVKECIGIPFPDTDARLVDPGDSTKEVPKGSPGELAVRGPQVMKGYWNQPAETAFVLRDGWLLTGDIATMDEEGYFSIVDRKKDLILCSGYNVYPREVEEVLFMHPAVAEAVAIGIPDPYRGETVKAFVVLKTGASATEEDVIAFCKERLAAFKVPKAVEFTTDLPKSLVGKVLRRILREREMERSRPAA